MKFFLGLDLGTTNIKAVLFDEYWNEVFTTAKEVVTNVTSNGHSEQNPEEVANEADRLLAECLAHARERNISIEAVGLSAAMHAFMAVDKHTRPVTPLVTWSDTRAAELARRLKSSLSLKDYQRHFNVPLHPTLPLLKWLWFNEQEDFRRNACKVVSLKDYILFRWFGRWLTDVSLAAATGYFDITTLNWNTRLLKELDLDEGMLPEVCAVNTTLQNWEEPYRKKYGVAELPPVVVGSSDGCLANLSAGVVDHRKASLTIGTSGAVRTAITHPIFADKGLFCYPVFEHYYVAGGAANNGGNVMHWIKKTLNLSDADFWQQFEVALAQVPAGSEQLLFVPYLFGERAPIWDPSIRASFIGLSGAHGSAHLIRACAEGIAFSLKHILSRLSEESGSIETIVADGGFTRSDHWVQLTADVLGTTIEVPHTPFGAALGAAMVARMACEGKPLKSLDFPQNEKKTFSPDPQRQKTYQACFRQYLKATSFLQDYFGELL